MSYGLDFDYINSNSDENIAKYGNDCRKIYYDKLIDDKVIPVDNANHLIALNMPDNVILGVYSFKVRRVG